MNKEELEKIEITLKNCKPYNELGTYTHFNCESIEQLLQERNNYKELYEKEKEKTDKAQKWIGEYKMQWDLYDEIQTDLNELNRILGDK